MTLRCRACVAPVFAGCAGRSGGCSMLMLTAGVLARLSARKPVSAHQFAFVEGAACYWHMVDMLWIVLFPLLYFLR